MRGMLTLNLSFLVQSIAIARPTIAHTTRQQTAALQDFDPGHVRFGSKAKKFDLSMRCPLWVKSGKAQNEHITSALSPKADIASVPRYVRSVATRTLVHLTLARPVARSSRLSSKSRVGLGATGYGQSASQVCRDPSGRHSFSRQCVTLAQACVSVARGLEGDLDVAADAAGCECKGDRTAELLRDEIANDADAVSAVGRSCNGGAANLAPCDRQVRRLLTRSAGPVHLNPSLPCRPCAGLRR